MGHSERSEESIGINRLPRFFATLRMTAFDIFVKIWVGFYFVQTFLISKTAL